MDQTCLQILTTKYWEKVDKKTCEQYFLTQNFDIVFLFRLRVYMQNVAFIFLLENFMLA